MKATVLINSRTGLYRVYEDSGDEFFLEGGVWVDVMEETPVSPDRQREMFDVIDRAFPQWREYRGQAQIEVDIVPGSYYHVCWLPSILPDNVISIEKLRRDLSLRGE